MKIRGFSSGLFGWKTRCLHDGHDPVMENILRDCKASGLDAVEVDATPELLGLMRANGLAVSAAYTNILLHKPYAELKIKETILPMAERLAQAGGTDLLINPNPKGGWEDPQLKTEDEIKHQGENLTHIAELIKPFRLKLCTHNHAAQKQNAERDLRAVVEYTGSEVGLCIDTGWAHVSGFDPIEWVRTYPNRVFALHFRNQMGVIPSEDLLEGEIRMPDLMKELSEIGYDGWISLELWHREDNHPQRTMMEDVSRSIEYLRGLLSGEERS